MLDIALPVGALLIALYLDVRLGEPAHRIHPVVWIGHFLNWAARQRVSPRPLGQWLAGVGFWLLGASLVASIGLLVSMALQHAPWWLHGIGLALVLKPSFSWGMLKREVLAVEAALADSLDKGRERVRYLCSRDVSSLSEHQVRQTAIETLAENLNDSFVAPVFWFLMAGLPGVWVYRFANTADAMWGYFGSRNGRDWTWFGQWTARADDVLSWLPARITALLLWCVARNFSWLDLKREASKTPSPNSGWPMAAMALALHVQLEKPNVYVLNPEGQQPRNMDTSQAIQLASRCVSVLGLVSGIVLASALTVLFFSGSCGVLCELCSLLS
jgi:adenosylcobinamide-phosphate synthase